MTATISIPEPVRDRLRTYGTAGMTYKDILGWMMDRIDREEFVRECRHILQSTPADAWVDLDDIE